MKQKDVVDEVKNRTGYNKKDIRVVFSVVYDIMMENMTLATYDEPSEITLFSGWRLGAKKVPEREWREPQNGGTTIAAEKFIPYCKFKQSFRDKINNLDFDAEFDEEDISEDD